MFANVLVFVNDPHDRGFFPYVIALANDTDTAFTLLGHVPINSESADPVEWQLIEIETEMALHNLVETLHHEGVSASAVLLDCPEHMTLAQALARHVVDTNADLLILDGASRELLLDPELWQTGIAVSVLSRDITGQGEPSQQIRKVMVPLDCSLRAECVLPITEQLCQLIQAELLLAHVVGCTDIPPRLEHDAHILDLVNQVVEYKRAEGQRYLDQIQSSLPIESEIRLVVNDNIRHALNAIAVQEEADLVILSAHGLSGNPDWPYGSVTYSFIAHNTLPLLIIPDTGSEGTTTSWTTEVPAPARPNHVD